MQALQYLSRSVELHDSSELKADALHLKGGLLKDMGILGDAEEVGVAQRWGWPKGGG